MRITQATPIFANMDKWASVGLSKLTKRPQDVSTMIIIINYKYK